MSENSPLQSPGKYIYIDSIVGNIRLKESNGVVKELAFLETPYEAHLFPPESKAKTQLEEYFANKRKKFTFEITPAGTEFEKKVWDIVSKIPFGKTMTYGEIAKKLGDPNLSRAVGMANGKNPIPIIIPCHRVIGADGTLTGYSGGMWRKQKLLSHEGYLNQGELFL